MAVADLILPVFAVILTGWAAGYFGYVSRSLAEALIHFAYNIAMPALLVVTIGQEPARSLLAWRFLMAFGGGSLLCFAAVFLMSGRWAGPAMPSRTMYALCASMTNTGFVALPILQALYGPHAVLPAAIATVFVAVVMFPLAVLLLELRGPAGRVRGGMLARHILLNPMVLSTLLGVVWAIVGQPIPGPVAAYLKIFADALTPCALFAIGLGLSLDGVRANLGPSLALAAIKLIAMPVLVYGLALLCGLDPLYTIAAVICAAVPTAKTVFILAGEHHCEEPLVASTISITTLFSIVSLVIWLYALSGLNAGAAVGH
ncbi:transporter [Labrys miyagiensis]|uniref:Transporter n=1 Tax=Labrys miyagiensis TaxID=346912 RepID=A0ABQ6CWD9_9HYPH|nr:AEC family transporter [Labrys miyagiensis]GLS23335.1 transporter [Labrys miyagiensis]